ncbi:E3 ubiquitin-protein ligase RNF126-like [Hyla sarda]|uniref:E3 ubiquitin-protein ligase RNF126-like n=1 Tax=Hyla sarda TaxID=327740 RepID=UPI0024C3C2A4|nr:E3 ubiquitin-protein ligase RNF126-like [Hyla sarda]XP_056390850.1 E3 ubiquitin-protein ligase RNF126-like [Hyla sarda]XP_056390851.1 E3 ubiquitin-protein ligase RNF126-like [Hyla sarda]XP_056390852.1 E3 ubiquitin-protein ligase RNF126-like [Hyla sarda]XP_056391666.1 E3 ubiquitin-protein ligase RNF126-like [Hyla sarda]XP_056391834.1 E3 ubiquitin-protein ligase RNF126-like [Hyla sarda]XP_056392262.1 E3 ubiquitin-protein ligase RNF126-like [Hyla sarda]
MGSRELRLLTADNEAWLRRPENAGQTILRERLRLRTRGAPYQTGPPPSRPRDRRRQAIEALPRRKIPPGETQTCPICLADYDSGEEVTVLPCSHMFHHLCIGQWLRTNDRCPMCRGRCIHLRT